MGLRIWLVFAVLLGKIQLQPAAADDININFLGNFSCEKNLQCLKNATTEGGYLKLTGGAARPQSDYFSSIGVALLRDSFQLFNKSTKLPASFNITFNFQIEAHSTTKAKGGDGMAFVMFANNSWYGEAGMQLGVYLNGLSGTQTFAVEFDTMKNEWDVDDNHVGIDTDNIISEVNRSLSTLPTDLELRKAKRVYVWLEYNAMNLTFEVRVHVGSLRPLEPFLTYQVDLYAIFNELEHVWLGFSGANPALPGAYSIYTIHEMEVSSFFPSKSSGGGGSDAGMIVAIVLLVVSLCLGLLSLCWLRRRHKTQNQLATTARDRSEQPLVFWKGAYTLKHFTFQELSAATKQFGKEFVLGQGGFGSVYRGELTDSGELVAIKKLNPDSKQGGREFEAEVTIISQLRHRNIVQLLGWCIDGGTYFLVYGLMPNGSLDKAITNPSFVLSWSHRLNILAGTAAALNYLHKGWKKQVIHRDIKPSNIMLDENFEAMLGDFGLARMLNHQNTLDTTSHVAGSHGFLAPEVHVNGKFTDRTDVFAFGAVLLEVACGRKACDNRLDDPERLLVDWVWSRYGEDKLLSVVDSRLKEAYDVQEMEMVLLLGLLCSHPNPAERPTIHKVGEILAGNMAVPQVPRSKPEPVYLSYDQYMQQGEGLSSEDRSSGYNSSSAGSQAEVRIEVTRLTPSRYSGPPWH